MLWGSPTCTREWSCHALLRSSNLSVSSYACQLGSSGRARLSPPDCWQISLSRIRAILFSRSRRYSERLSRLTKRSRLSPWPRRVGWWWPGTVPARSKSWVGYFWLITITPKHFAPFPHCCVFFFFTCSRFELFRLEILIKQQSNTNISVDQTTLDLL